MRESDAAVGGLNVIGVNVAFGGTGSGLTVEIVQAKITKVENKNMMCDFFTETILELKYVKEPGP